MSFSSNEAWVESGKKLPGTVGLILFGVVISTITASFNGEKTITVEEIKAAEMVCEDHSELSSIHKKIFGGNEVICKDNFVVVLPAE